MDPFIGREKEIKKLEKLFENQTANLVVVKGRRRIGKSRLIEEFGKRYKFYHFVGLNPRVGLTAQNQRDEFARQLRRQCELPALKADDWGDLFLLLAKETKTGRVVIFFDEISWIAIDDPDFLGKLKIVWDSHFKNNTKLVLVLCGSVSSWIQKNILDSTGYFGRPSLSLNVDELPLDKCNKFWGKYGEKISGFEKLKLLAITGGVPRYLELIKPSRAADENIRDLFFDKDSALFGEYDHIFTEIYSNRNAIYRPIIEFLVNGRATQEEISKELKIAQSGDLSEYLDDLVLGGFLARDYTWNIVKNKMSNLSHYRLKDNYTRFALKYIQPNILRIEKGLFTDRSVSSLPGWDTIMGLQFENLVLNNFNKIIKTLGVMPDEILFANPFFQRKTKKIPGCQVDYLIQTRDTAYIFEIKFSRFEITKSIIQEVSKKIESIKLPKHMSRRAILIHVNGVREDVVDSLFFSKIINFSDFLD